jgi:hypothetical protein
LILVSCSSIKPRPTIRYINTIEVPFNEEFKTLLSVVYQVSIMT